LKIGTHVLSLAIVLFSLVSTRADGQGDARELVRAVLRNEASHASDPNCATYLSYESSKRTGGHLWEEKVVEFQGGILRRLISIDGLPLGQERALREDTRIADLVAHPEKWNRTSTAQNSDRRLSAALLEAMSRAFHFTYVDERQGCSRIRFTPDASFEPRGVEQKVLHTLEGELLVHRTDLRICSVRAKITSETRVGLGLLADIQPGGRIDFRRTRLRNRVWITQSIDLNLHGRALMLRSISEEHTEYHSEIREIAQGTSLHEAEELLRASEKR
jgi:hypothetical protein